MMLTARGAALLVGAVLLWGVGRLIGVAELYVVAVASAALVGVGALAVRLLAATIAVRRSASSARLLYGSTGEVHVRLRNDSRLVAPPLLVSDEVHWTLADRPRFVVAGLPPGATTTLAYPVRATQRGRFSVGPLTIRVRDPFGLTQLARRYERADEIVVYPEVEPLEVGVVGGDHRGTGSSQARRLFNSGDEFHTMREYVQGDDLRMIHWASTAHRATLMVRQNEMPWQAEATIVCDLRSRAHTGAGADSTFEKALSVAASVVWHLADHHYQLRLLTEDDVRTRGVEPWEALLERLAVAEQSSARGLAPTLQALRGRGGEGLLVTIVPAPTGSQPVARHPDVRALLGAGRGHTGRIAVVVHTGRHQAARADECAALLRSAGWKATTVAVGQPFADSWRALSGVRRAAPAYAPDAPRASATATRER